MNQNHRRDFANFRVPHLLHERIYPSRMKPVFFAFMGVLCLMPALRAQDDADSHKQKFFCGEVWDKAGNLAVTSQSFKKNLWDGYEISLGPARNSQGDDSVRCTAAIYNSAGRVVYRTTGYSVIFNEDLTGQDFDGDGKPEVVFQTDTGGGQHCCEAYNVISLFPKAHTLVDIDAPGAVDFEKDSQGRMVIWQRLPGPYGYTSMAAQPFAEKVSRVGEGKLVDATPQFCSRIFSDKNEDYRDWVATLTPESIKALKTTGAEDPNNEETVSALLSRALQHVFCRQFDAAMSDLNHWPEAGRKEMRAKFADSIKDDYPDFVVRLVDTKP